MVITGDFNPALNLEDSALGPSSYNKGMRDFQDFIHQIEVLDNNSSGLHFTWNQKPKSGKGVFKKIDRIMGNIQLLDSFPLSFALFQLYGLSDHSPCVLKILGMVRNKHPPFKFANFLTHKAEFGKIVGDVWCSRVDGVPQFRVVKLKLLKKPLRGLFFNQGNIHKKVVDLRWLLHDVQKVIDLDPFNSELCDKETLYVQQLQEASLDGEVPETKV